MKNGTSYVIEIDPDKRPKTIDLFVTELHTVEEQAGEVTNHVIKGKFLAFKGIYAVEGKTLKVCLPNDEDGDRPAGFDNQKANCEAYVLRPITPGGGR